jgi:hypothetical protein
MLVTLTVTSDDGTELGHAQLPEGDIEGMLGRHYNFRLYGVAGVPVTATARFGTAPKGAKNA